MALALNNLQRVDMPLNKETKPNQTKPYVYTSNLSDLKNIVLIRFYKGAAVYTKTAMFKLLKTIK